MTLPCKLKPPHINIGKGMEVQFHHFFTMLFYEPPFSSWWFQPIWKICSSNWIISPSLSRDEEKKWNHHPVLYSKGLSSSKRSFTIFFNGDWLQWKIEPLPCLRVTAWRWFISFGPPAYFEGRVLLVVLRIYVKILFSRLPNQKQFDMLHIFKTKKAMQITSPEN